MNAMVALVFVFGIYVVQKKSVLRCVMDVMKKARRALMKLTFYSLSSLYGRTIRPFLPSVLLWFHPVRARPLSYTAGPLSSNARIGLFLTWIFIFSIFMRRITNARWFERL